MNVVKVEKNEPLLEIGVSAVGASQTICSRLRRPVAPLCCTEGP